MLAFDHFIHKREDCSTDIEVLLRACVVNIGEAILMGEFLEIVLLHELVDHWLILNEIVLVAGQYHRDTFMLFIHKLVIYFYFPLLRTRERELARLTSQVSLDE